MPVVERKKTSVIPRCIPPDELRAKIGAERRGLLRRLSALLDRPMTVLSFVWFGLMLIDFISGLGPTLDFLSYCIWALFVFHFLLEFWIAPEKVRYLRSNAITALALLLPAFRMFRVVRAFKLLRLAKLNRGMRLVRWLTSLNRGMKATQHTLRKRGLVYVLALTALVDFGGAAGIYWIENPQALHEAGYGSFNGGSIGSYSEALWWTSMMLTTMGSDYFPKTGEGRIITLLLAVYAFAIFGYITATVASLIIRVDQAQTERAKEEADRD